MGKKIAIPKPSNRGAVRTNFALPILAFVILIEVIAAKPLHNWMMRSAVSETSEHWVAHFSAEIPKAMETGDFIPVAIAVETALDTLTTSSISFFDTHCECEIAAGWGGEFSRESFAEGLLRLISNQLPEGSIIGFGHAQSAFGQDGFGDETFAAHTIDDGHDHGKHIIGEFERIPLEGGRYIGLQMHFDVGNLAQSQFVMIEILGVAMTALSGLALLTAERFARRSHHAHNLSIEKAQYLAEHDPLTELLNRYGFQVRAETMIEANKDGSGRLCLVQIDVDRFKDINDLHGHPTGDKAIQCIAEHINRNFPEGSIAARLGGDEFGVLVDEEALGGDAAVFLEYMSMHTQFMVRGGAQEIQVGMTAGYAIYPNDGQSLSDLMKSADLALLSAKNTSKGIATRYHESMSEALESRIGEIEGMRVALSEHRILPFYQPIIEASSGKVAGFEALARWNHPERGILSPAAFENALLDPSTSLAITDRMLEEIADDLSHWHSLGFKVRAGLNLGEADLKQPNLPEKLSDALVSRGLPNTALTIEVTESAVFASNLADVLPVLRGIRNHGIGVALDDFGTGASSLMLLQTLPCTSVKIDKSFVSNCLTDDSSMAIVRALIKLGKDLGLSTVAEGVETLKQVEVLERLEVDKLRAIASPARCRARASRTFCVSCRS